MSTTGKVIARKMAAAVEGDFVVFLIGMRINRFWKIHKWLPVFIAMPRMLRELKNKPEVGLLGYRVHSGFRNHLVIQYWRSFEHLERYARNPELIHRRAWAAFHRSVGTSGDVGIWHETYPITAGTYEASYINMPPFGLGAVGPLIPATGRWDSAAGRMGLPERGDPPPLFKDR